jgi:8-oxo-dGTP pyrophosphatase MutT (NUDIX family)
MTMVSNTPLPSATVVLLRDGESGLETYLVKRHGRTAFGNAWAFPGGVVDASDARVHSSCQGIDPDNLDRLLDVPNAANYYSAAIRELFEETGVLLGKASASAAELDAARDALNDGRLAWDEFVDSACVALECDRLHYLSYWITPAGLPKRFATRFFLARMPATEVAHHCGRELVDCRWLTTSEALAEHRDGKLSMIFPTVSTLEFLDAFEHSDAAIAAANHIAGEGIVPILPKAIDSGGKREIVLPGDPRYASTST